MLLVTGLEIYAVLSYARIIWTVYIGIYMGP